VFGDYKRTEKKTISNVAKMLLRRFLFSMEHKIIDYNYHNVELLKDQLNRMVEINYELQSEITTLLTELNIVRFVAEASNGKLGMGENQDKNM